MGRDQVWVNGKSYECPAPCLGSTPIDLNVVSATVLVAALLVVVANLAVDIVYGFLDPRVAVA